MDQDTKENIEQLQALEQNLQHLLMQKQSIQIQQGEIESALSALEKNTKQVFKITGAVMIESSKDILTNELNSKKEMLNIKIKSVEKQEEKLKKNMKDIQEKVLANFHKK